jgi:hypothetical protein
MANKRRIVVEDIARLMAYGLAVYDADGHKVGSVAGYDAAAGWMKVDHRVFAPTDLDLYVPFSVIMSIDPHEIYLSLPKDVLERDYCTLAPYPHHARDWAGQLSVGMQASTVLGDDLGTITHYDPVAGRFLVENRRVAERTFSVPVALVDSVSHDARKVFIAVTTADLQQLALTNPTGVLFVPAEGPEAALRTE